MAKQGDLRVWWIPQVPMTRFFVNVSNYDEAGLVLDTLANYDEFQFKHRVKPDYCNAGGVEEFDAELNEWTEWYEGETGESFDEWWHEFKKGGVGKS